LPLILQEVREADADIICLQELNHFGEHRRHTEQQPHAATCSRPAEAHAYRRKLKPASARGQQQQLNSCDKAAATPAVCSVACVPVTRATDVLAAALVPEGYSCFFRAKKPSPATKFGFPADGIALFYRHSRFSCSPAPEGAQAGSGQTQPPAGGRVGREGCCRHCSGKYVCTCRLYHRSCDLDSYRCCALLCGAAVLPAVQHTALNPLTATQQRRAL
jgi:hypothetical protein